MQALRPQIRFDIKAMNLRSGFWRLLYKHAYAVIYVPTDFVTY
jgi:hypothetical protein